MTSTATGVDGFIVRSASEGQSFITEFLNSPDFDIESLKSICKQSEIPHTSNHKRTLAETIARDAMIYPIVKKIVIEQLIPPWKNWFAFMKGRPRIPLAGSDPCGLLDGLGEEKWYGPIHISTDDCVWFIRPIHLVHWEDLGQSDDNKLNGKRHLTKSTIRWLCFARFSDNFVSIHWRGLSHNDESSDSGRDSKSPVKTWVYVPQLFQEIQKLTQTRFTEVNLYDLVLLHLWDNFRYDKQNYVWKDLRIRSEIAGVKLNARSSLIVEHEFDGGETPGIKKLANTIRLAVLNELSAKYKYTVDDPEHFDEVILRTLIQDFGALSYEFAIEKVDGEKLFHGHCYLGVRPDQGSEDSYPHIHVLKSYGDYSKQLEFVLDNVRTNNDDKDQPKQASLF